MKRSPITTALAAVITAAAVIMATAGFATPPDPAPESAQIQTTTEVVDESTSIVTMEIPESSGLEGPTEVLIVDAVPEEIAIDVTDAYGRSIADTMIVEHITADSEDSFTVTVRSSATGESIIIDTTRAEQQVVPVIIAVLVTIGIKAALKIASKAAIKEAAKKSLLALGKDKWTHIMVSKHNWSRLAKTKDEIAEIMSNAMVNGTRSTDREHVEFTWAHRGQTIVVRTSLKGHISNGWIK